MHTTTHNPAYPPTHNKKLQYKLRNHKPTKLWSKATQWLPVTLPNAYQHYEKWKKKLPNGKSKLGADLFLQWFEIYGYPGRLYIV